MQTSSQPTTINGINIKQAAAYYQSNAAACMDHGRDGWASAEVWYRALAGMAAQVVKRTEGVR